MSAATTRAPASIGVIGTTAAHALFIGALLFATHRSSQEPMIAYAVNLVAAPAPSNAATKSGNVAPPKPQPEKAVAAKPTVKSRKPEPKKPEPKKPAPPQTKPAPKNTPASSVTTPLKGETPSTGQDVITKSFPGLDFPDKDYLAAIVNEIYSRFESDAAWPAGLEATVGFTIHRDGTITDIVMLKSSRWPPFNTRARGAVDALQKARVLRPLPAMWPDDKLEIAFSFSPRKP